MSNGRTMLFSRLNAPLYIIALVITYSWCISYNAYRVSLKNRPLTQHVSISHLEEHTAEITPTENHHCTRDRMHIVVTTDKQFFGRDFWIFSLSTPVYLYYRSANFSLRPSMHFPKTVHLRHLGDTADDSSGFYLHIFQFYDCLPDVIAHVHDHGDSWHTNVQTMTSRILTALKGNWLEGMQTLSGDGTSSNAWFSNRAQEMHGFCTDNFAEERDPNISNTSLPALKQVLQSNGIQLNRSARNFCCGTFLVGQVNIIRHPRQLYKDLYALFLDPAYNKRQLGGAPYHALEFLVWPLLSTDSCKPVKLEHCTLEYQGDCCYKSGCSGDIVM